MERPAGVNAIAFCFGVVGVYLFTSGIATLVLPDREPLRQITLLVLGLLFVGPYVSLLAGVFAGMIAVGLWRLNKWGRWAAMIMAAAGILTLAPGVSSPRLGWTFAASGLGIILRVMLLWYLWRDDVARVFAGLR